MAETTQNRMIMLPSDPGYFDILHGFIPPWELAAHHDGDHAMVVDSGTGLLRSANFGEIEEYVYGGELDEVEATYNDC